MGTTNVNTTGRRHRNTQGLTHELREALFAVPISTRPRTGIPAGTGPPSHLHRKAWNMEHLDCISHRRYRIEIIADEDAGNPFTEWDGAPTLVLHNKAERNFGWSTDKGWIAVLEEALDQIAERGIVKNMYGPGGALEIVNRWLRVAHGIPVVLTVSAIEHSGTAVYLGASALPADLGGWDSGWIGWLFATREQINQWGCKDKAPGEIEQSLRDSFTEFAAWVAGDVVGYRIFDPDGVEVESCYGFYGSDCMAEPDGWALAQCKELIDHDIASREHQLTLPLEESA